MRGGMQHEYGGVRHTFPNVTVCHRFRPSCLLLLSIFALLASSLCAPASGATCVTRSGSSLDEHPVSLSKTNHTTVSLSKTAPPSNPCKAGPPLPDPSNQMSPPRPPVPLPAPAAAPTHPPRLGDPVARLSPVHTPTLIPPAAPAPGTPSRYPVEPPLPLAPVPPANTPGPESEEPPPRPAPVPPAGTPGPEPEETPAPFPSLPERTAGMTGGAKAGIALASLAGLLQVVVVIFLMARRRQLIKGINQPADWGQGRDSRIL